MRRFLIHAAIAVVLINAPLSVFFVGWGLKLIYEAAGMAVFLTACASISIASLGIASLFDKSQGQEILPPRDR